LCASVGLIKSALKLLMHGANMKTVIKSFTFYPKLTIFLGKINFRNVMFQLNVTAIWPFLNLYKIRMKIRISITTILAHLSSYCRLYFVDDSFRCSQTKYT